MNCRIHQISETVIRSSVGTNIIPKSQQLWLINQRGRLIVSLKYVRNMCFYVFSLSLSQRVVCGCRLTLFRCRPTLAHTLILSLCLSATLPFFLPFKKVLRHLHGYHWNTRFDCIRLFSFHKGSTNTKQIQLQRQAPVVKRYVYSHNFQLPLGPQSTALKH